MPKAITESTITGNVLHEWTMQEYEQHTRHKRWYILVGTISVVCLFYGLLTGNFMFVLILILFGIILYLQAHQEPPQVVFQITDIGVILGNRFYNYSEFSAFYIIYQPSEVKTLYLETSSTTRPTLRIPLLDQNPLEIRETLSQFLEEDVEKEEEPLSDRFGRNWEIH